MAFKNEYLHGNAPDKSVITLLSKTALRKSRISWGKATERTLKWNSRLLEL